MRMGVPATLGLRLLLVATVLFVGALGSEYDWQWGRATYFTGDFHYGSCGYGYIPQVNRPDFHVLAVPDTNWNYQGSCGNCYEVKCNPAQYKDNWGQSYDRRNACKDPNKVVTFVATDACPCQYNNQWCCGDSFHFDLADTGFAELANRVEGTIGILIRRVQCPPGFFLGKENFFHGKGR